jgi:transcriptional regulator with XRE-family HTH domain
MSNTRHDRAEVRRLLELRDSEGLTFKELAERSGVPVHVLNHRASQDRKARHAEEDGAQGFIEIVSNEEAPSSSLASRSSGIELFLPGGIRVQLGRQFDEAALARLLSIARC